MDERGTVAACAACVRMARIVFPWSVPTCCYTRAALFAGCFPWVPARARALHCAVRPANLLHAAWFSAQQAITAAVPPSPPGEVEPLHARALPWACCPDRTHQF